MRSFLSLLFVLLLTSVFASPSIGQVKPGAPKGKPGTPTAPKGDPKKDNPPAATQPRKFKCEIVKNNIGTYSIQLTNNGSSLGEGGWSIHVKACPSGGGACQELIFNYEFNGFSAGAVHTAGSVTFEGTCTATKWCHYKKNVDPYPCP